MEHEIGMKSVRGATMALCSVHIEGQINGLMLSTSIRQHYHNDSGKPLEIVYTFPLGHGVSLLGMDAEIGGKRLQATVIEKRQAEQKYEKTLDEGDSPILVQESSPGLYTANLGNIKANEAVSIEIHCAQLLRFEQGHIRVKIPTVIAPRYGDQHGKIGLAPHETARADFAAAYPLTVRIHILGEMAKAQLTSPSHKIRLVPGEDGVTALLEAGAMLDRDFILLLEGLAGHTFAVSAHDAEEHTVLASFCPRLPQSRGPLALKILADCSGSMSGDSIFEAKKALESVCKALRPDDYLSYSRFGSTVRHEMRVMKTCTGPVLKQFRQAIAATDANMGGTEMAQALHAVIEKIGTPESFRPCLLLITDDLTWDAKNILQTCLDSGHRIFAIGVGSAPAETLLREMCEATGGACEFVAPNEEISNAAMRLFSRMRTTQPQKMRVTWDVEPRWQSALPVSVFDEETLHVFATFAEAPAKMPELSWEENGQSTCVKAEKVDVTENFDLIRLGAARRMLKAGKEDALAIALKYQLVSTKTSLFLAHLREGDDKVTELPELHQISQMMAAGSHGYGTVVRSFHQSAIAGRNCMMMGMSRPPSRQPGGDRFVFDEDESFDIPCFIRANGGGGGRSAKSKIIAAEDLGPAFPSEISSMDDLLFGDIAIDSESKPTSTASVESPLFLLEQFEQMVLENKKMSDIINALISTSIRLAEFTERLGEQEGLSSRAIWGALIDWLLDRFVETYTPARQVRRLLRAELKGIDSVQINSLRLAFGAMWPAL